MAEEKKGTPVEKWDEVNGAASGVKELQGFNSERNPLRSIEDMVEQNDNQLDGVINNVPAQDFAAQKIGADAAQEEKKSILEKIRESSPKSDKTRHISRCYEEMTRS